MNGPAGGTTSSLDQLYQQVILDHYRQKHGHGLRDDGDAALGESRQFNPLCGDEVTVRVALSGVDDTATPIVVRDLSWTGEGCSISQASTSMLHDLVCGRPLAQAEKVVEAFRAMVRARGQGEPDEDLLEDATALNGVGRHANRVKCAMLGWTAFEAAVLAARAATTEEDADE